MSLYSCMLELVHDLCTAVASSLYTSFYSLPRIATKIQDQVHTAVAVRSYSCNRTTSYSSDTYRTGLLRSHSCTLHDHEHVYTAPSEPASTCTNMDPLSMLLLPRRRPACAGCLSVQLSCLSRGGERMQDRWAGCMPLPRCAHACLPDRQ